MPSRKSRISRLSSRSISLELSSTSKRTVNFLYRLLPFLWLLHSAPFLRSYSKNSTVTLSTLLPLPSSGHAEEPSLRKKILITERSLVTGGKANGKLPLSFPPKEQCSTTSSSTPETQKEELSPVSSQNGQRPWWLLTTTPVEVTSWVTLLCPPRRVLPLNTLSRSISLSIIQSS